MVDKSLPFVSIIMPIRNEADFIEQAIRSVLDNDYPADRMELLVVDGMSDDGTRDIIKRLAVEDPRIKLLDNYHHIVPHAMNKGIKESQGDIIIRVDGHAAVARDFVSQSVQVLNEHPDVWCVGGVMNTVGTTYWGRVIAAAMSSPFGVGMGNFRLGNVEGYVDAVIFGAHRRWVFDRVGMFDEELVRNQDDEFIQRMVEAGAKQYMSLKIHSTYFSRSNWRKLTHQYFQYGFWRIRTMQKHRRPAVFRQAVPLLFVSFLIALALAGFTSQTFWWILATVLGVYVLGLVYGSIYVGRKAGWKYSFLATIVFAILHFGYGFGSLWGIVRFVLLRGRFMAKSTDAKLSR